MTTTLTREDAIVHPPKTVGDRALTLAVMAAATQVQVQLIEGEITLNQRLQALSDALLENRVEATTLPGSNTLDLLGTLLVEIVEDVEDTTGLSASLLAERRPYGLALVLNPEQTQPQLRRVLPAGS